MSTTKPPVGRQSPKVYRRRRILLVVILLAVIVVIVLIVVRPGSSNGDQAGAPTGTATAPAQSSTPVPSATADSACSSSNVTVGAITDAQTYAAGQLPKLSLSLTNTGSAPCKINAGTAQQVFTITSGTETYWKSTDCQKNATNTEVVLQPGKTVTTGSPITWDRTRSDPATCSANRPQVPAAGASYHLQTSVAGIASTSTQQFILN